MQGAEPLDRRLPQLSRLEAWHLPLNTRRRRKKKVEANAFADAGVIDPLAELDIDIQSFDIPRLVTVYPDKAGIKWWTKLWINGKNEGEASVEITRELAIRFMANNFDKEQWLEEYYPQQMEMYHQAIDATREQLLHASLM